MLAGGRTLLSPPFRAGVVVAEANRKPVKQCIDQAAAAFGYERIVTQPTHSGGVPGDVNFVLLAQEHAPSRHIADAAMSVVSQGGERPRACTWASGCCARHPGLEVCSSSSSKGGAKPKGTDPGGRSTRLSKQANERSSL